MLNKESQKCINIIKKVNKLIKLNNIKSLNKCSVLDDQFIIVKRLWNDCIITGNNYFVNNEETREILMQNLNSPFISNKIKKVVNKINECYIFKEDGITVYWYGNSWKKFANSVLKRLVITKKLIAPNHPEIIIVIAPTKIKKNIKFNEGDQIGIDKVNSGSSLIYHNDISYIFLWREEELEKVAIHEMIHALSADHELYIKNIIDCAVYKWLNIGKNMININETFTEVTANILHAMYIGCEVKKDFYLFLQIERGFSLVQAAKLLKQLGYNDFNKLERDNLEKNQFEFKQKTNTVAYYILRAGVMYLFNDYCQMISEWETPWVFPKNDIYKNTFLKLIMKGCKEMELKELIKKINHTTMRMTCLELQR